MGGAINFKKYRGIKNNGYVKTITYTCDFAIKKIYMFFNPVYLYIWRLIFFFFFIIEMKAEEFWIWLANFFFFFHFPFQKIVILAPKGETTFLKPEVEHFHDSFLITLHKKKKKKSQKKWHALVKPLPIIREEKNCYWKKKIFSFRLFFFLHLLFLSVS